MENRNKVFLRQVLGGTVQGEVKVWENMKRMGMMGRLMKQNKAWDCETRALYTWASYTVVGVRVQKGTVSQEFNIAVIVAEQSWGGVLVSYYCITNNHKNSWWYATVSID